MDKAYNFKDTEEKIYDLWEKSGAFAPKIQKGKKPFTIILPPPNANAPLHLGHALYTVEDILVRWHRMQGDPTLWLPGADHAGFETQVVFEKQLAKEDKSRFDYDRETLYKMIWDFVQNNKSTMEGQLRKLGFSLDWSRKKFTLDPDVVATTQQTFKKLYDAGLIYRDKRLVNFCTKHGTGFSDLEIEHVEKLEKLYFIKVQVQGEKELIVATVRPETIPGDVAIAVNPTDKRYKNYVGKTATNPVNGNPLPIIADDYVDKKFGTGVVKITPAHDEQDFEVAKRHKLEFIEVIDERGKLKDAGKYSGLKVAIAREKITEDLKEKRLIEKIEDYTHTVGTCYKCGTTLEPLLLPQWYVKAKPLAKKAIEVVKSEKIKIVPNRFEKVYMRWLTEIRDWNISRQIVWGIRIPAWYCRDCDKWTVTGGNTPMACDNCGGSNIIQESDNFDTWFSSGQWPFAALGYPDSKDYKYFYPTSVMETGYDILFFWVARMIMLGIFVTGKIPFEVVYLHGLVRDSKGQKMSKSKGNVINPMDMVDRYGADALRMSLIASVGAGNDQNFTESKLVGFRNFSNKIWNASRFAMEFKNTGAEDKEFDKWLTNIIKETNKYLVEFKVGNAGEFLYNEFWHTFCDVYIEKAKKGELSGKQIKNGLTTFLKLLHPFMPFVTEAIWQEIFAKDKFDLLINAPFPK